MTLFFFKKDKEESRIHPRHYNVLNSGTNPITNNQNRAKATTTGIRLQRRSKQRSRPKSTNQTSQPAQPKGEKTTQGHTRRGQHRNIPEPGPDCRSRSRKLPNREPKASLSRQGLIKELKQA
jgi:hypothetical protein